MGARHSYCISVCGRNPGNIRKKCNGLTVDHTAGIYPVNATGVPFNASYFASKGDAITDLTEDMAAEQKARTTYDNILRLCDDPDVMEPIKFLREREVIHFQRFGEAMRVVRDHLDSKNFYAFNPEFDKQYKK